MFGEWHYIISKTLTAFYCFYSEFSLINKDNKDSLVKKKKKKKLNGTVTSVAKIHEHFSSKISNGFQKSENKYIK